MAAHTNTKGNGCLPAGRDWAAWALKMTAPSPLLTVPCNVPSGEDPGKLASRGPTPAPSVPECVLRDVSVSPAADNPLNPAYQKSPMSPVRSQGAPGPSPHAERPFLPCPASPSTSRSASWLPRPSDTVQNPNLVADIGEVQRPRRRAILRNSKEKSFTWRR